MSLLRRVATAAIIGPSFKLFSIVGGVMVSRHLASDTWLLTRGLPLTRGT